MDPHEGKSKVNKLCDVIAEALERVDRQRYFTESPGPVWFSAGALLISTSWLPVLFLWSRCSAHTIALFSDSEHDRFVLSLLTAYVVKSPPDLKRALATIRDMRDRERAQAQAQAASAGRVVGECLCSASWLRLLGLFPWLLLGRVCMLCDLFSLLNLAICCNSFAQRSKPQSQPQDQV